MKKIVFISLLLILFALTATVFTAENTTSKVNTAEKTAAKANTAENGAAKTGTAENTEVKVPNKKKVYRDTKEKVTVVPVSTAASAGPFVQLYQVSLDLKPTDVVLLYGQFAVTNDTKKPIGVGRYISRDGTVNVVHPVAENVTPDMHHYAPAFVAVDDSHGGGHHDYYLTIYAFSTRALPNETLPVAANYGHLIAVVLSE